jgi:hypothetical protein
MSTSAVPPAASPPHPGRAYALLGTALALLGPLAYGLQIFAKVLTVPWYLPVLGTVGAGLLALSLSYSRSVWRSMGLVLFGLLAAGEWFFLLEMTRLPPYTGPLEVGRPFPAFTTTLANGKSFNQARLAGDKNTVMVFFRGRW